MWGRSGGSSPCRWVLSVLMASRNDSRQPAAPKVSPPIASRPTFTPRRNITCTASLALLAVGVLAQAGRTGTALHVAGWSFLLGSLVFSGSLYILAVTGLKWLGAITPFGGVAMLIGWLALALAAGSYAKQ